MNGKASVSKELNDKHRKILETLLRLPENRECADCKSRAPRWASVNLGIFICLQCSGIHRSLGVHISKVRSATLDTWLPEQISFIQNTGNKKSNTFWEEELPSNYKRSEIENFIRAKYVEKRWIPRNGVIKPALKSSQPKPSLPRSEIDNGSRRPNSNGVAHVSAEKRMDYDLPKAIVTATENRSPKPTIVTPQVISGGTKPQERVQELKPAFSEIKTIKQQTDISPVLLPPKVDYATELFQLLCTDDSKPNNSSPRVAIPPLRLLPPQEKPVLGIMNYNPTPHPMNQRLSPPSQTKLHPTIAANSSYGAVLYNGQSYTMQGRSINRAANGIQTPFGNLPQVQIASSTTYSSQSMYYPGQGPPIGGALSMSPRFQSSPKPRPAFTPTPSGWDYDFSSLTQGLFAKR